MMVLLIILCVFSAKINKKEGQQHQIWDKVDCPGGGCNYLWCPYSTFLHVLKLTTKPGQSLHTAINLISAVYTLQLYTLQFLQLTYFKQYRLSPFKIWISSRSFNMKIWFSCYFIRSNIYLIGFIFLLSLEDIPTLNLRPFAAFNSVLQRCMYGWHGWRRPVAH